MELRVCESGSPGVWAWRWSWSWRLCLANGQDGHSNMTISTVTATRNPPPATTTDTTSTTPSILTEIASQTKEAEQLFAMQTECCKCANASKDYSSSVHEPKEEGREPKEQEQVVVWCGSSAWSVLREGDWIASDSSSV
ncbi:GL12927 [Drosophila persimilis]|uniref:GL12927 n=1 Tax=Drosophila persimilis TaxID=7234 RepID=B4GV07_DROPE|nr:GL12927 [Drosophila persimilis]